MSVQQRLLRRAVAQFHKPTGLGGRLAGWVMSHRQSNLERNRWVVDLLDIRPDERVLELGCGPGVALAAIAERLIGGGGTAVGVDHSAVMIETARRRNAEAVAAGRVQLVCAAVEDLPTFGAPFDVALAVNTVGFWGEPEERLRAVREQLRAGGRIALVSQPRCPGATAETSRAAGAELAALLTQAGYTDITSDTLDLDPPAVCVRATAP